MINFMVRYKAATMDALVRFYAEIQLCGAIAKTRGEAGCIRYEYFFPAVTLFDNEVFKDPDYKPDAEMFLWEQWESRDAQAAHTKQPHFQKIGELKAKYGVTSSFDVQDILTPF